MTGCRGQMRGRSFASSVFYSSPSNFLLLKIRIGKPFFAIESVGLKSMMIFCIETVVFVAANFAQVLAD